MVRSNFDGLRDAQVDSYPFWYRAVQCFPDQNKKNLETHSVNAPANIPISEQWHRAAEAWADLESAATLLEETKSAVLSQMMERQGDIPVSKAEMKVKASQEWAQHITKIVRSRGAANKAKVQLEYLRMKFWEWQSENANHRMQSRF